MDGSKRGAPKEALFWSVGQGHVVYEDGSIEPAVRVTAGTSSVMVTPFAARRMAAFLLLAADDVEAAQNGMAPGRSL